ncbi:MAG: accessory factor UbiK family protein [Pseudomonadota bacterium]|nr:accessory factor UbiK family protein [Pseudomonadota bacterium]
MSAISEAISKIMEKLPSDVNYLKHDFEKHVKNILEDLLEKMEIVTQQEFEVQKEVLAKTRSKLEVLEEKITELEKSD